jgi:hypothetical protein
VLRMIMRLGTHGGHQAPVHPCHTFALVYPDRTVDHPRVFRVQGGIIMNEFGPARRKHKTVERRRTIKEGRRVREVSAGAPRFTAKIEWSTRLT